MTPLPQPRITEDGRLAWLMIAAAFLVHLALGWLPQINLEWAFSDALLYFQDLDKGRIDRYFSVQANTLGLSYLSYLVASLLPGLDTVHTPRLASSFGILLLGAALIRFGKILEFNRSDVLLVMLALINPAIWTYSGRGTADFLPVAIALFSVSLFWDKTITFTGIAIATIAFSVAILIKYHAALLLPLIWIERLSRIDIDYKSTLKRLFAISACILLGPLVYVLVVRHSLGFWFIPPAFQSDFQFSFASFMTNFLSYLGYLSLLLIPLSVLPIVGRAATPRSLLKLALLFSALFVLGYLALKPGGEMNFGPLDRYLSSELANGVLCASAGLLVFVLKDCFGTHNMRETRRLLACMVVGIIIFIAVLSFTRPAQRYLLFVLPLAYYFLAIGKSKRKIIVGSTIVLMMSINLYIGISQIATGRAANDVVQILADHGLLDETSPGDVLGHVGNEFRLDLDPGEFAYTVVNGHHPEQILSVESAPVPLIRRVYSVIPKSE